MGADTQVALGGPIAVTGATGFVGRHLLARLLQTEGLPAERLRALTRRRRPDAVAAAARDGVRWIQGSLAAEDALARLVEGCRLVIHVAGATRAFDATGFWEANARGTERLMRAIRRAAEEDCRVLHVSSLAAREPGISPYAASKRAGEEAVATALPAQRWIVLRPPALYGPGDRELLPLLLLSRRGWLPVAGHPDQRLALLHVADLVDLILFCCMEDAFTRLAGRRLEVDDGRGGYGYHEIAAILSDLWGRPVRLLRVPGPVVRTVARLNQGWARLIGRPAMLAPHKLPELWHPDWSVRLPADLAALWRPAHDLASGLRASLTGRL